MTPTVTPDFEYVTYLRATPEQVWDALTDPDLTALYWAHRNVSDWTPGATWEHRRLDDGVAEAGGRVLEAERPRLLRMTFGDPTGPDDKRSVCRFTLTPGPGMTRLVVIHSALPSPEDRAAVAHGWPAVLAGLKTLLETGEPLPAAPWEMHP